MKTMITTFTTPFGTRAFTGTVSVKALADMKATLAIIEDGVTYTITATDAEITLADAGMNVKCKNFWVNL